MHIVQEDGHVTLVSSRLPMAHTIDDEIVIGLMPFDPCPQLVAVLLSGPADGAVIVQCQDVIEGRGVSLQAPSQCRWYI